MNASRFALPLALALAAAPAGAVREPGRTLTAAAQQGDTARVAALLRDGADADARDREAGTALDVAEKNGRSEVAALLRASGARGSGKSIGDVVCVTPWDGSGFCGRVASRHGNETAISVLWLEGCGEGCAADRECSEDRTVGGTTREALRTGAMLTVPAWCLTRTAVLPRP